MHGISIGIRSVEAAIQPPVSEWVTTKSRILLPRGPASYMFTLGSRILYAGSTKNLRARISGHRWERGEIGGYRFSGNPSEVRLSYRLTERWIDAIDIEDRLLHNLKPELNRVFFAAYSRRAVWGK